jgi:hypothetical protein
MIAFLAFLKQICKRIGCELTVFYKNDYFITQILPETVKLFTWNLPRSFLPEFHSGEGGRLYLPHNPLTTSLYIDNVY